eukprot:m51a1_g8427 putative adenylate guanylate cyclase catalytic domain protein (947) ;mRNA; f:337626-340969
MDGRGFDTSLPGALDSQSSIGLSAVTVSIVASDGTPTRHSKASLDVACSASPPPNPTLVVCASVAQSPRRVTTMSLRPGAQGVMTSSMSLAPGGLGVATPALRTPSRIDADDPRMQRLAGHLGSAASGEAAPRPLGASGSGTAAYGSSMRLIAERVFSSMANLNASRASAKVCPEGVGKDGRPTAAGSPDALADAAFVAPTLRSALRRAYVKTALIPAVVVVISFIVCIVIVESTSVAVITDGMEKQARDAIRSVVSSSGVQLFSVYDQAEFAVTAASRVLLQALRTPRTPTAAELATTGWANYSDWRPVWDVRNDTGSNSHACFATPNLTQQLVVDVMWRTGGLDPLWASIIGRNPDFRMMYFTSSLALGAFQRTFPFLPDECEGYDEWEDASWYSAADEAHNPQGTIVWTEPYEDPYIHQWMTSCLFPIYVNRTLLGVFGIDMLTTDLVAGVTALELPADGYAIVITKEGSVQAVSENSPVYWKAKLNSENSSADGLVDRALIAESSNIEGVFTARWNGADIDASWAKIGRTGTIFIVAIERQRVLSVIHRVSLQQAIVTAVAAVIVAVALAVGVVLSVAQLQRIRDFIGQPLCTVQGTLMQFGNGTFAVSMPPMPLQELQDTSNSVQHAGGLLDKAFRELEALQEAMGVFVPKPFLDLLGINEITSMKLNQCCTWARMTVLFIDIRNFSGLIEPLTLQRMFQFLNRYLSFVVPIIEKHRGFVDKYIADAIMALFPIDPCDAVQAATEMFAAIERLNATRDADLPPVSVGVGMATGKVVLGTMGVKSRMEVSVIGDIVNVASRLVSLTRTFDATCLVTAEVALAWSGRRDQNTVSQSTGEDYVNAPFVRNVGEINVKGKAVPISVWELIPQNCEQFDAKMRNSGGIAGAIKNFRNGHFEQCLATLAELDSTDPVVRLYQSECSKLRHAGSGKKTGAYTIVMESK